MTNNQKRFCDEYLIDCNATRAYKAAYPATTKQRTAEAAGHRLLSNVEVKAYIEQKLNEMSSAKIAEAKEVMEYLTSVMRREKMDSVVVTLTKKLEKWVKDEDTGKLKKQTVTEDEPCIVEIPAKLSDANKAAELLGKRYSLFTDKVEVGIEGGVIKVEITDD